MSTNIERAAEVLQVPIHWKADGTPKHWIVDQTDAELQTRALAAEGLLVTDEQPCRTCNGDGLVPGMNHAPGDLLFVCPACHGSGFRHPALTDEQQRLIRLGEAVERVRRLALNEGGDGDAIRVYDWIYNEAERGDK